VDVPVISTSEGMLVSYSTERLPLWADNDEDCEVPPADNMARKRFMAAGGKID
jgi:hypothetical protein